MVELIKLFLRLGATSFGGPAAHIAMMEDEFVHRRQWITHRKFLELLALSNLIPGPNSTELAIHIGYQRAGWKGFFAAGLSFILPAFFIVTFLGWFYQSFSELPQVQDFLWGAKPVVLAIILLAAERFLRQILELKTYADFTKSSFWAQKYHVLSLFIIGVSLYLNFTGVNEIAILFNCGLMSLFLARRFTPQVQRELGSLFLAFLKVGSVLFGSGYVLLSFLQEELVQNRGWLTQAQLLDAISIGQFTPGPVFTTATFIGFIKEGFSGAAVATLGIFLPAFVFVALSIPLYRKMQESALLKDILNGVIAGSLGLLLFTLWNLTQEFLMNPWAIVIFFTSLFALKYTRFSSALLILGGGLLSLLAAKI